MTFIAAHESGGCPRLPTWAMQQNRQLIRGMLGAATANISRYVDGSFPGWVECTLVAALGDVLEQQEERANERRKEMVAARATKHVEGSEPARLPQKSPIHGLGRPSSLSKKYQGNDWIGNDEHTQSRNTEVEHS
jgi:hypothetical protein